MGKASSNESLRDKSYRGSVVDCVRWIPLWSTIACTPATRDNHIETTDESSAHPGRRDVIEPIAARWNSENAALELTFDELGSNPVTLRVRGYLFSSSGIERISSDLRTVEQLDKSQRITFDLSEHLEKLPEKNSIHIWIDVASLPTEDEHSIWSQPRRLSLVFDETTDRWREQRDTEKHFEPAWIIDASDGELPRAPSLQLCFDIIATYQDSKIGEDYWTEMSAPRPARGVWASIREDGREIFSGYLSVGLDAVPDKEMDSPADTAGCTPYLIRDRWGAAVFDVELESRAQLGFNTILVRNASSPDTARHYSSAILPVDVGRWRWTVDPHSPEQDDPFNVLLASTLAFSRLDAATSPTEYAIVTQSEIECAPCSDGDTIHIDETHTHSKFVIAREIGRQSYDFLADGRFAGADCSFDAPSCPSSEGSHSMLSQEYLSCSVAEGAAHFFSAWVFNASDEDDCWMQSNQDDDPTTRIVNCQEENASFLRAYLDRSCDGDGTGYGVELDWMRQFWDLVSHRDTDNNAPNFSDILAWLRSSAPWSNTDSYQKLDAAAQALDSSLKSNWNTWKGYNGIVH